MSDYEVNCFGRNVFLSFNTIWHIIYSMGTQLSSKIVARNFVLWALKVRKHYSKPCVIQPRTINSSLSYTCSTN